MTVASMCESLNEKGICSSDCCGIVPIRAPVLYRNRNMYQVKITKQVPTNEGIFPLTEDGFCVFLNRKKHKCMIYLSRPEVCRIYGTVKDLRCPYIKMNGTVRTEKEQEDMKFKIAKDIDEKLGRFQ